jgi:hypothetical protein
VLHLGIGNFPIKSKFAPALRRFGQKSTPRSLYRLWHPRGNRNYLSFLSGFVIRARMRFSAYGRDNPRLRNLRNPDKILFP